MEPRVLDCLQVVRAWSRDRLFHFRFSVVLEQNPDVKPGRSLKKIRFYRVTSRPGPQILLGLDCHQSLFRAKSGARRFKLDRIHTGRILARIRLHCCGRRRQTRAESEPGAHTEEWAAHTTVLVQVCWRVACRTHSSELFVPARDAQSFLPAYRECWRAPMLHFHYLLFY